MTGSGTEADPYVIRDVNDLQDMDLDLTAYYILGGNINATETSGWNGGLGFDPVGKAAPNYFAGQLDGKNYTITNLTVNRPATDYVGLFGIVVDGTIQNVNLASVDLHGEDFTGGLVGVISDTSIIKNITASGVVVGNDYVGGGVGYTNGGLVLSSSSATCSVTSDNGVAGTLNDIGGFIGYGEGIDVDGCFATGAVVGVGEHVGGFIGDFIAGNIDASYCTGAVETGDNGGRSVAGGFVGWSNGDSTDCYSRGSVTATGNEVGGFAGVSGQETNCYSMGAVSGVGGDVGGFCGTADTVVNCFWDTDTSGQASSSGGTGKTTALMKAIATFQAAGWAISRIWNLSALCNDGYPCLIGVNICCPAFSSGDETISEPTVVLEAIRNIEIVYGGRVFIDKSGNFTYETRYTRNV